MIFITKLIKLGMHSDTGIVDPGVKASISFNHSFYHVAQVLAYTHFTLYVIGSATRARDGMADSLQSITIPSDQYDASTTSAAMRAVAKPIPELPPVITIVCCESAFNLMRMRVLLRLYE